MKASIVIAVRNDARIVSCLESIFAKGAVGFDGQFEVIVVENSATPCLEGDITAFPVRYLVESRVGMGYARAHALKHTTGDFVVFTDADCVVSEGWLSKLLLPFDRPEIGLVGGPIEKLSIRTTVEKYQKNLADGQTELQYLPAIYPKPYVVTANAAYRSAAIRAAGGIDPLFFSGGDVDLAWRVGRLGYKAAIAPGALVFHACRPTYRKVFTQYYTYSLGHSLLFRKYRRETNTSICLDSYPFKGISRGLLRLAMALIQPASSEARNRKIGESCFELIEHSALLAGALVGSGRFKVLYI